MSKNNTTYKRTILGFIVMTISQESSAALSLSDEQWCLQHKKRRIGHKTTGRAAAAAVEENRVGARASPPGDSSDDEVIQRNWEKKTKK